MILYVSFIIDISYYDNGFYSLYKSANMEKNSGILKWELYDVTMRHFLYYLEIYQYCRYKEDIIIAKIINIYTAKSVLEENKKVYRQS